MIKRIKNKVAVFREKSDVQKCIMMISVVYKESTFCERNRYESR